MTAVVLKGPLIMRPASVRLSLFLQYLCECLMHPHCNFVDVCVCPTLCMLIQLVIWWSRRQNEFKSQHCRKLSKCLIYFLLSLSLHTFQVHTHYEWRLTTYHKSKKQKCFIKSCFKAELSLEWEKQLRLICSFNTVESICRCHLQISGFQENNCLFAPVHTRALLNIIVDGRWFRGSAHEHLR